MTHYLHIAEKIAAGRARMRSAGAARTMGGGGYAFP